MGSDVNGTGRVEICIGEVWGTICDDNWSNVDAQVACIGLGFSALGMYAFLLASISNCIGVIMGFVCGVFKFLTQGNPLGY